MRIQEVAQRAHNGGRFIIPGKEVAGGVKWIAGAKPDPALNQSIVIGWVPHFSIAQRIEKVKTIQHKGIYVRGIKAICGS